MALFVFYKYVELSRFAYSQQLQHPKNPLKIAYKLS